MPAPKRAVETLLHRATKGERKQSEQNIPIPSKQGAADTRSQVICYPMRAPDRCTDDSKSQSEKHKLHDQEMGKSGKGKIQ